MKILITGGSGFIGTNLANHFIATGHEVTLYDNLSRRGTEKNLAWLREQYRDKFRFIQGDVRDYTSLCQAVRGVHAVYHLASQVAVTTSVKNPREDFEINLLGTFNLLEAVRENADKPIVIFTSTNKVYGKMDNLPVVEEDKYYRFEDHPYGISEEQCLDFHSPYGCSKGAADQYMRDYVRIYDIPTVVFRMSCIYGPRQLGTEDQGWVAYFIIAATLGYSISIYGNGKQVRDILFVEDLVRAFELATNRIDVTAGQVYNIGGGKENTIAIWAEFGPILSELTGREIPVQYKEWRQGDQPVYISDIRKAQRDFGWQPQISKAEGISRLYQWITSHRDLFKA